MLIKSTLLNLTTYMFSCGLAPVMVVEEIEKIIRLFLWGTSEGKRKIHLVSFEGFAYHWSLEDWALKGFGKMFPSFVNGFGDLRKIIYGFVF